jgi:signal transduction histidine kinase
MKGNGTSSGLDVIGAIEREQRQIGDELHDNICQTLAGTSMLLETIGRAVSAGKPISAEAFRELGRNLETAIDQTRALSQRYRPTELEGGGLMKALEELARANPSCIFRCEKPVFIQDAAKSLAVFRVAQEAVRNALEHANAEKICITLQRIGVRVVLKIKDNGNGFNPRSSNGKSHGLAVMQYRAAAAGGLLRIASRRGTGTTIAFTVPAK